jgi:hypothetical protein
MNSFHSRIPNAVKAAPNPGIFIGRLRAYDWCRRREESVMRLSLVVPALSAIAIVAGIPAAFAFESAPQDQFPSSTMSTKLADPDDIIQDMSQRYTGNTATIYHSGPITIGIMGPGGGAYGGTSPFLDDPAANTVLSKRQW